jgi:hypothetical protein
VVRHALVGVVDTVPDAADNTGSDAQETAESEDN